VRLKYAAIRNWKVNGQPSARRRRLVLRCDGSERRREIDFYETRPHRWGALCASKPDIASWGGFEKTKPNRFGLLGLFWPSRFGSDTGSRYEPDGGDVVVADEIFEAKNNHLLGTSIGGDATLTRVALLGFVVFFVVVLARAR
jgi:hypothetical protein